MAELIYQELTNSILAAVVEVHRFLGPGLLESAYQGCLAQELFNRGHSVVTQQGLPLNYKGLKLDEGYRLDIVVDGKVVLEI